MAEMNVRKKLLIDPLQSNCYSEESMMEEDKRISEGSVLSRKFENNSLLNNNNNNNKANMYEDNNNEILSQIKKKKGGEQDENVEKMDKSCKVCRIM